MSSGAQAQVALRGPQDVYMLATNDHTFWKTTYARHTNFAITELEQNFQMTAGYGMNRVIGKIGRNGDLCSGVYLYTELPAITYVDAPPVYDLSTNTWASYVNAFGHALIDRLVALIGGSDFDTQYGEVMELMEALMAPPEKLMGEQNFRFFSPAGAAASSTHPNRLWTPFKFWFCKFYEQALPLIALYWHDVEIELSTRPLSQLVMYGSSGLCGPANVSIPTAPTRMTMLVNYVYLDRAERAAFADGEHEYVFDQIQYLGPQSVHTGDGTIQHNIRFNHPVQELLWVCQRTAATVLNDWFNFGGMPDPGAQALDTRTSDPFLRAKITLNGHDRTIEHPAPYYRLVQPWQAHSRYPASDRMVYCYSFAIRPEELLDTGSVNFSRFDNAYLNITYNSSVPLQWDGVTRIYARNKNVLKITVGMAGKKFAA